MPQNKPTKFMDSAIFMLHNYASSQREESLLLRLLQTALQEEINFEMRSFNRGARGQNALRQILAPVVKEIIEDESLNVRTDPVDIYKSWVNQMGCQNGEAGKKSLMSVPRETYTALALPGRCGNWKFWGVLKRALSAFARGRTEQSDKKQLRVQGIVYLVLISCQFQLVVPAVMGVACSEISCGPDMTRMEAENNGKPLLVREESSLNIPAIAAAHVIKRYVAQAPGELSLEVGDLVCVIDMPPQELSPRWRGKHGFQVGFFPGECVELINGKIPESLINSVPKPVPKKRGKLLTFLRSVVKARPKQRKEREVEKERVFGRDLGEHLLHSGRDVPQVLQSCAEFIEQHGVVQGIYRLSGVASNVQRLRQEFESEQVPELTVRDVHSASSLCKMYFRELPNPLLTDQLYDKFSDAVGATTEEERLVRMRDVIQQLPAPHYRTLAYLMRHLACLAGHCSTTNMHAKNLAIVWAPNLLRSQQSESACASGRAACTELQMQSSVVEFIIDHTDILFCSTSGPDIAAGAGQSSLSGPQSVQASSPATELLSLEEAQARRRGHSSSPVIVTESRDIEVEEGPTAVRGKFHTVIDFPSERPSPPSKIKESPAGCWCSCFSLGKPSSGTKRQLQRNAREPAETQVVVLAGDLSSCQPSRAGASSDAGLYASTNGELAGSTSGCGSADSLPHNNSDGHEELIQVQALISPGSAEDADLSLPETTGTSLDCDPVPLQCSPAQAQPECPDSSTSVQEQVSNNEDKPCLLEGDLESGLQSQAPDINTDSAEPLCP